MAMRRDYRAEPVRRMVVAGESNAYGMCATDPRNEWVQVVAAGIRDHQDGWLEVRNNAIPANVVSPDAPGFLRADKPGTSPSLVERLDRDVIDHAPDLAIFAYGMNDARCGHAAGSFLAAYGDAIRRTREALPDALIVLVGPYWVPQFDADLWSSPDYDATRRYFGRFADGGENLVAEYNAGIARIAEAHACVFADIYPALRGSLWLVHEGDNVHFTDIGQRVIGDLVFATIALNASFLATRSKRAYREGGLELVHTGGTAAMPEVVRTWRYLDPDDFEWFNPPLPADPTV